MHQCTSDKHKNSCSRMYSTWSWSVNATMAGVTLSPASLATTSAFPSCKVKLSKSILCRIVHIKRLRKRRHVLFFVFMGTKSMWGNNPHFSEVAFAYCERTLRFRWWFNSLIQTWGYQPFGNQIRWSAYIGALVFVVTMFLLVLILHMGMMRHVI